jgi:hypothetical protein
MVTTLRACGVVPLIGVCAEAENADGRAPQERDPAVVGVGQGR